MAIKSAKKKPAAKKSGKSSSKAACYGWKAILDTMPPAPLKLYVTGKCSFPTHGYKVTLKEAVPQGINPLILILRKLVKPPTGIVIQTPQIVTVEFKKKTKKKYTNVTILPDNVTIKVKVVA